MGWLLADERSGWGQYHHSAHQAPVCFACKMPRRTGKETSAARTAASCRGLSVQGAGSRINARPLLVRSTLGSLNRVRHYSWSENAHIVRQNVIYVTYYLRRDFASIPENIRFHREPEAYPRGIPPRHTPEAPASNIGLPSFNHTYEILHTEMQATNSVQFPGNASLRHALHRACCLYCTPAHPSVPRLNPTWRDASQHSRPEGPQQQQQPSPCSTTPVMYANLFERRSFSSCPS